MKVFVRGLEFAAFHGITAAEREIGHRLRIDLVAEVEEQASVTDRIEDTLDYARLCLRAREICNQGACKTLEHVCERLGKGLLTEFPAIIWIDVSLSKVTPPIAANVQALGVENRFKRDSSGV